MTQKGVNPNILDLGEDALMSKVLALEKAFELEEQEQEAPKQGGENIRWEAIPESRLIGKETVFLGSDFALELSSVDQISDLIKLFKELPKEEKVQTEEPKQKPVPSRVKNERVESVLDARRAQAISIAMKKLKIQPDSPAKFTWALREMNETVLTSQAIGVLLSCPLWPISEEESNALESKQALDGKLAEPDRLISFVIQAVPDVVTRINALAFRYEFEVSLEDTAKATIELKHNYKLIQMNSNLKVVVRSAILVGNSINQSSGKSITGCTLASLNKLAFTRTIRDRRVTVMDIVASYCLRCYPDYAGLDELQPLVASSKKLELEAQVKNIRDMRRGMEALRRIKQMEKYADDAMRRLDIVESELGVTRGSYDALLEYFGIAKGEMETAMFFEQFGVFLDHWSKAISRKLKEQKTLAAAQMAEVAAQQATERSALRKAEKEERERQRQEEEDANRGRLRLTVNLRGFKLQRRNKGTGEAALVLSELDGEELELDGTKPSHDGLKQRKLKDASENASRASTRNKARRSMFWG